VLLRIDAFDKIPEHRHVCATSHWRDRCLIRPCCGTASRWSARLPMLNSRRRRFGSTPGMH